MSFAPVSGISPRQSFGAYLPHSAAIPLQPRIMKPVQASSDDRFEYKQPGRVSFGADSSPPQKPRPRRRAFKLFNVAAAWLALLGACGSTYKIHTLQTELAEVKRPAVTSTIQLNKTPSLKDSLSEETLRELLVQLFTGVIQDVAPSNVKIEGKRSLGSGTWLQAIDGKLYILTNDHVIDNNSIKGSRERPTFKIRLYNGSDTETAQWLEAQLVRSPNGQFARSKSHDMALLEITDPNFKLPDNVQPLKFRDLQKNPLKVGEPVFMIGAPIGMTDNVTFGIISHIERTLKLEPRNIFVGVDASINPGNSGGALYDLEGNFIGIPTAKEDEGEGLGFVLRTDIVLDVLINTFGIHPAS